MGTEKISGLKFHDFSIGERISKQKVESWVNSILDKLREFDKKKFYYHISSGDSIVIANAFRSKSDQNLYDLTIIIANSEGYKAYNGEFKV